LVGSVGAGQDRRVTKQQSPLDTALDLLVYAPVGLLVTAAEEIPKLAAKGRTRVGGQVGMARVVGQFAVAQGRKELSKRLSAATGGDAGEEWQSEPGDGQDSVFATGEARPDDSSGDFGSGPATGPPAGPAPATSAADGAGPDRTSGSDADPAPGDGTADVGWARPVSQFRPAALAIPGYDSLAASQVVPRLAGLSPEELAAVGAYETAHRARRTILTRVRQLQER
jgi:hypothetical protein